MWWRRWVGGVVKLQSESAIGKTSFPRKMYLWIHIRLTRNMTTMSRKQAINFGLRKFSFKEIIDNQRKVVEVYAWMIAPTSFGKSLVFWSLESLFSLFTDPVLPQSSFICGKNCFLISMIFSNKVVVVSGAVSTNHSVKQLSPSSFAPRRISNSHPLETRSLKKHSSIILVWNIFHTWNTICFFRIWRELTRYTAVVEVRSSPTD